MRTACLLFITVMIGAAACDEAVDDHDTTAGPGESDPDTDTDTGTTDADATTDATGETPTTGDTPGDTSVGGPQTTLAGPSDVNAPPAARE